MVDCRDSAIGLPSMGSSKRHDLSMPEASQSQPLSRDVRSADAARGRSDEPPLYTIDLSLPPSERYVAVANEFKKEIKDLTGLFADLVHDVHPKLPVAPFTMLGKVFLRGLYREEETEEIKGVSKATGVPMYLLVAFNLLLDTFMGCSSGGVRVRDTKKPSDTRMLHYRTLDWGMDPLRKVVVRLKYIRSPDPTPIAQVVTYVGYVGVLTGVKPGLSLSLNFRAEHDNTTRTKEWQYYWHVLQVVLGLRPSISSVLRSCIFRQPEDEKKKHMPTFTAKQSHIEMVVEALRRTKTCAAFLVASDPYETFVLEKDLDDAKVLRSRSFVAATNSDVRHDPAELDEPVPSKFELQTSRGLNGRTALEGLIEESVDRKQCMTEKWKDACERYRSKRPDAKDEDVSVSEREVIKWVNDFPVTNEATHFACLMDPRRGEILWCRRRKELAGPPKHFEMKEE